MIVKELYTTEEIAELGNICKETVRRRRSKFIKEGKNIVWFKTEQRPYLHSYRFLSEFISDSMYSIIETNRQMKNTIDCLHSHRSFEKQLSFLEWDYFVTIAYEKDYSNKTCFTLMNKMYEAVDDYAFSGDTRMFFVTEPFTNRKGYHNHCVVKAGLSTDILKQVIERSTPKARIDIIPFQREKAGVFYICKNGFKGEDWDILGSNLKDDGIYLEKIGSA